MIEHKGDFWQIVDALPEPAIICVTTNGVVKTSGELVMGKGIALQFAQRFPALAYQLGKHVAARGNIAFSIRYPGCQHLIASFPTKHHWRNDSDLHLIHKSAIYLHDLVIDTRQDAYITRPGCGNGHLSWEQKVKPLLEKLNWGDRLHIVS